MAGTINIIVIMIVLEKGYYDHGRRQGGGCGGSNPPPTRPQKKWKKKILILNIFGLLNSKGISDGILGMKIFSPADLSDRIDASLTFGCKFFTINRVPLHNFGGFKFLSIKIGDLIFKNT